MKPSEAAGIILVDNPGKFLSGSVSRRVLHDIASVLRLIARLLALGGGLRLLLLIASLLALSRGLTGGSGLIFALLPMLGASLLLAF